MYTPKRDSVLHVMGYQSNKLGMLEKYIIRLAIKSREHDIESIFVFDTIPKSRTFVKLLEENHVIYYVADAFHPIEFFICMNLIFKKHNPQIVHSHFKASLPSVYAWLFGCKHRWNTIHLMMIDRKCKEIRKIRNLKLRSIILRHITNIFTNKSFCVSHAACQQYQAVFPKHADKYITLHNGAQKSDYDRKESRIKLQFDENNIYICCVAFAAEFKGVDILMRAFVQLKTKTSKSTKLCLIGLSPKHEITNAVLEIADENNLSGDIINFGIIDNVPEILSAMDIYVQPSRTECLSYALIEAGLAGLPSIGSNVGGNPEIIIDGKTGYLFESENYHDLSDKLLVMINDSELRKKMGLESRAHKLKNFLMDDKISILLGHYEEALCSM
jgi:glycosyltransferase involved in cell wall biosynthesis